MYSNGQSIHQDNHFHDHIELKVPVQVYYDDGNHADIGYVLELTEEFVQVNGTAYNRNLFRFISRPGY
jgi:hypothetical protein